MALLGWCLRLGVALCVWRPCWLASVDQMFLYHLTGQQEEGFSAGLLQHRARRQTDLKSDSSSSTSTVVPTICNTNHTHECVCSKCATKIKDAEVKCCQDSLPPSWLQESVLIHISGLTTDTYKEKETLVKTVLAEQVRWFCGTTPSCSFKPRADLGQILNSDSVLVVYLNASVSGEGWTGLGFVVLVPPNSLTTRRKRHVDYASTSENLNSNGIPSPLFKDTVSRYRRATNHMVENSTDETELWVALPSQVGIRAVETDHKTLTAQLGLEVRSDASELWPLLALSEESQSGGFVWSAKNLAGVIVGGIAAFLLLLSCFASAIKACRDRTKIKKRNQIKRDERARRRAENKKGTDKEQLTPTAEPDKGQVDNTQQETPEVKVEATEVTETPSEHVVTATIHSSPQDTAGTITNGVLPDGTHGDSRGRTSNGHALTGVVVPHENGVVANGQVPPAGGGDERPAELSNGVGGLQVPNHSNPGVDNPAYELSPTTPP